MSCTFTSPSDLALITVFSSIFRPTTKDAFTSLIVKSWSATCAHMSCASVLTCGHVVIATPPSNTCVSATARARILMFEISSWKKRFTSVGSAPCLLSHAAASNVLTPVFTANPLVSTVIPARSASASSFARLFFLLMYCRISATSSDAEDAYDSI